MTAGVVVVVLLLLVLVGPVVVVVEDGGPAWLQAGARDKVLAALDKARRGQGLAPLTPLDGRHETAQSFARLKSEGKALPVSW